jgi:predicted metal-dependent peptidase
MRKAAEENLKKGKVQLAIHQPFFGQLVLGRKIKITDEDVIPIGGGKAQRFTACVDAKGNITVGVRFLSELSVQQVVFLLAHEAMHYAMLHAMRRAHRDPRAWNYAADAVINDVLKSSGVGEFIDCAVDLPGSKDKTAEQIYEEIPEDPNGGCYQPGTGWDDIAEGDSQVDDATAREIEQQVRVELAQAAQVAKMQGKLPAGLEQMIDEIVNPITPWHILLERYMTNFINADYTWARPKRQLINMGIYLPSSDKRPQMGAMGIFRDTSGSCMSPADQAHFLGHINSIIEKCRPEIVYVVDCDCVVEQVKEYTPEDLPIQPGEHNPKGGGGTSFIPPFEWVREQGIELEVAVYLTDMYGTMPEEDPGYPVVWLSTSDVKEAPFGDVIQYTVE